MPEYSKKILKMCAMERSLNEIHFRQVNLFNKLLNHSQHANHKYNLVKQAIHHVIDHHENFVLFGVTLF